MAELTPRNPSPKFSLRLPVSLRTRLIAANILIIAISLSVVGYYVYYRGQLASTFLAGKLDTSVRQNAIDGLTANITIQADAMNRLFTNVGDSIKNIGLGTNKMLSRQADLGTGGYWNAATSMTRLSKGSWANVDSNDQASVFLPSSVELTDPLIGELNTLKQLDFFVPDILASNPDVVAVYFGGPSGETVYYPNIGLANVVPANFDVTSRPWYRAAAPDADSGRTVVWSAPYLDAARNGLVITSSFPVYDTASSFRGVVAMDVQLHRLSNLVSTVRAGNTGYAFVVDRDGRLIAMADAGYADLGYSKDTMQLGQTFTDDHLPQPLPADLLSTVERMKAGKSGLETVSIKGQQRYIIFRPITEVGYNLAIVVPSAELLTSAAQARQLTTASTTSTQRTSFALVAAILLLSLLATLWIGSTLIAPLLALKHTADEITRGNLDARAPVRGRDEIATLGQTLNAMTSRLRDLIQSLETRVTERTAALEVVSSHADRRAAQFEAITQVTRAISSIRNMDELMPLISAVISQYFGFYHVGIFLNDENNEYAWLIAANSEGGRRMLQRRHNLKIGAQGIVGYVAARGETRVARSVGKDAVFFNNPDLPETKSEAALPLRRGAQVAGVLDVQSTKEDAFSDEDLGILAILADQVSLAMENTRLFEATRRSLMEAETLYRQYIQEGWNRRPQEGQITGYRYTPRGAAPITAGYNPATGTPIANDDGRPRIVVPIKLRGETIGNLVVQPQRQGSWTQDQMELVEAVAERVALSAENARLFDETNRRAERERLVTEITSRIRSTNDPDEMIRTAVEELRNALGASDIQVIPQVVPVTSSGERDTGTSAGTDADPAAQRGKGARK